MKRRESIRMWVITIHRETVGMFADMLDRLLLMVTAILTASILTALALAFCWTHYMGEPLSRLPTAVVAWTMTFVHPGERPPPSHHSRRPSL